MYYIIHRKFEFKANKIIIQKKKRSNNLKSRVSSDFN